MGRALLACWAIVGILLATLVVSHGCNSDSHQLVTGYDDCFIFCDQKIQDNRDKAKVTPELYDFEGVQCCKCNYEKLNPPETEPAAPDMIPTATIAPDLDPSTFQPPSESELLQASDPNYEPNVKAGETMNYAVIQIRGMPWRLPLNEKEIEAFVYAMNNVTGVPWQYKGAEPSVPNLIPFPPIGIPALQDENAPTAPAPPPPSPSPVPETVTVPEEVASAPAIPSRRRMKALKWTNRSRRRLAQQEDYTRDYYDPTYDYDYDPDKVNYGEQNGNLVPESSDFSGMQPPPDPYVQPSPDPYAQAPTDPFVQPSPDPYAQAPTNPLLPAESTTLVPSPALPPPPPPPPPSPPPPPPTINLPPNMDGIWYFARYPLDESQTKAMFQAMKSTAGQEAFKRSLEKSGITSVQNLTTRFLGPEKNGILDITKFVDLNNFEVDPSTDNESSESSGMDGATIGIIVGAVAGGIALIVLFIALLMSYNRRNSKKDKESLTSQWKREREIAEAESMKLDQANRPSIYKSLRWTAAQDAGFTTMTREEIDRKREMRKADSLSASQRLSQPSFMEPTPKSSRLDSMRNALGLNKSKLFGSPKPQESGSNLYSPSSANDEVEVESNRKWNIFKK